MERSDYRGRFAPSPTGPLHFGSLVAALGSYLDAKHHNGTWLVRIEDLDAPRTVKGADDDILRTLEACGLHWDETVIYQSRRTAAYHAAFERLRTGNLLYPCACSRKEVADSALHHGDEFVYPGTCRNGLPQGKTARAWRVRTDDQAISFDDALQGGHPDTVRVSGKCGRGGPAAAPANGCFAVTCRSRITQHLESEIGDFVVKRADGLFAYQLAVVVDDAAQGITHVVRGADLLTSTTRQIYLQRLLGFATPAYTHLPIAVNAQGEKLGKQTLAAPVDTNNPATTLLRALAFLRQEPPAELSGCDPETILDWASDNWDAGKMNGIRTLPAL
ncbi:MAG: tRNA glutamyl-Q(34) synthetase GluQRS [Nitrosomonadales bacterium]|nr:tRNA glutamyl-Q(34) synthetase GluQRS [Nitrosomonadales bacterium]